jgi:hypothetical protein
MTAKDSWPVKREGRVWFDRQLGQGNLAQIF